MRRQRRAAGDPGWRIAVKTPLSELTRLRAKRAAGESELRAQIMKAMLLCSGELGYRRAAVRDVYESYGGYRSQFYRYFADKEECFAAAYEAESERICSRLLEFAALQEPRIDRIEGALSYLADFAAAEPATAKAIFIEVHVAGGSALANHRKVVERLSRAIDSACRETESHHSPPPTTAEFIVGMVEQAMATSLAQDDPDELRAAVPEFARIFLDLFQAGRKASERQGR
jgi:AcrR family transcriptional regulator